MATNAERIVEDLIEAWNSHDVDKVASLFTDDCIYEDVAVGKVNRGKEELKTFVGATLVWSPDVKLEVRSIFGAENWVASEWVMTGNHSGDTREIPATGKRFSVRGASITELHNGKISRHSDYWNLSSFLQQVGLMPAGPPN